MGSISTKDTPGRTAREAALKFCTPWHLAELAEAGEQGAKKALSECDRRSASGLSVEQFIASYAMNAARVRAQRIRANGAMVPDAHRIELALSTFSVEEWKRIIQRLKQPDLRALRSYIEAHTSRLQSQLGSRLVREVVLAASDRDIKLYFAGKKPIRVSSPYWAVFYRAQARQANIARKPFKGRSRIETVSTGALAKHFSKRSERVSPYKIRKWLERAEAQPPEGLDGLAYWVWVYTGKMPHM